MGGPAACFTTVVERKQDDLPRYCIVHCDPHSLWGLTGASLVTGSFGPVAFERRTISPWGDGRWFFSLSESLCRAAGVGTGDPVELAIDRPERDEPDDLAAALKGREAAWTRLSPVDRRAIIVDVCEAKRPATRAARIDKWLARLANR